MACVEPLILLVTTFFYPLKSVLLNMDKNIEKATFAGGCFWCTEAVFKRVAGVEKVQSGFTGGFIKNPPYREVVTGRTGHAEAIDITFDPDIITYKELLEIFFATHDPTTLNRQQNDVGTHYRSAVFYHSQKQLETIQFVINSLEKQGVFEDPIVTEVTKADAFYNAEQEHRDYYDLHPTQPYCQYIINPKVNKLREVFASKLKA